MNGLAAKKKQVREQYLKIRRAIPCAKRHAKSRRIFRRLFRSSFFRKATHVVLYYGISPEVETRPFLKSILMTKALYLPRVNQKTRNISFLKISSLTKDLCRGAYNIREPKAGCVKRSPSRMDLIVVPGVAFDLKGRRLGRGGGYYDRVLRRAKKVCKVGLCFREQLMPSVPVTSRDQRVNQIITD